MSDCVIPLDHMSRDMVHHTPSNFPESSFPAGLYIFEVNEVVIRMIMKGRSRKVTHDTNARFGQFIWQTC